MGPMESMALIGTSFVLISLYRAITGVERRCRMLWHGAGRGRKRRSRTGRRGLRIRFSPARMRYFGRYGAFRS